MNAKLVMEITVTEFGSPLLYDLLTTCATPRERAAVFKACAEALLRERLSRNNPAPALDAASGSRNEAPDIRPARQEAWGPGPTDAVQQTASRSVSPPVSTTANANEPGAGLQALRTENPGNMSADFGNALGNGLADFY
jgi:hypothetical protein